MSATNHRTSDRVESTESTRPGGAARWRAAGPLLTAALWATWALVLVVLAFRTAHAVPDYSDTLRLVNDFIIPLEGATGAERFALFVDEYRLLGHSHILTRLAFLAAGSGGLYDFSIPGNIGRVAYLAMLAGIPAFIGTVGRRDGARYPWLGALLVLVVLIRPDGAVAYLNNFLAFEYVHIALGMAYIAVLATSLTGRVSMWWTLALGVLLAVVGDAPGATALLAGVGLAVWIAVRTRAFELRLLVPVIPIMASFLVILALGPWIGAGDPETDRAGLGNLVLWSARGVAQGVVDLREAAWSWIGLPGFRPLLIVVLAVLIGVIVIALLLRGDPAKTTQVFAVGLIGFGLVALIGAFATRSINPGEVFAWRYLRLFTPILGGVVALLVLRLEAEPFSLKTIGITSAVVAVLIARLAVGIPHVTSLIVHFENKETFFARYEPGTFDQLSGGMEEYFRFQMPYRYRNDDVAVSRILDWQAGHVRFDDH